MDLIFNEESQAWEEKKEPFATIEVETEEDFNRLRELVQADQDGRCVILSEKMKPMVFLAGGMDVYCPNCGETLSGGWELSDADDDRKMCQCPKCGQAINDMVCEQVERLPKGETNGEETD